MDWILRSGAAALTLALAVACGKEEAGAPTPPEPEGVEQGAGSPASGEQTPFEVTRLVMEKKLDAQRAERARLRNEIAELEAQKMGLGGGKHAEDIEAQIASLRATLEELDREIALTRATIGELAKE